MLYLWFILCGVIFNAYLGVCGHHMDLSLFTADIAMTNGCFNRLRPPSLPCQREPTHARKGHGANAVGVFAAAAAFSGGTGLERTTCALTHSATSAEWTGWRIEDTLTEEHEVALDCKSRRKSAKRTRGSTDDENVCDKWRWEGKEPGYEVPPPLSTLTQEGSWCQT